MELLGSVLVAALSLAGTLGGAYFANRRASALIAYRLEQLETQVQKHNSLIERTYRLEEQSELLSERIRVANHRLDDLERQ